MDKQKGGRTTFRLNFIKVVLPPCIFATLLKSSFCFNLA